MNYDLIKQTIDLISEFEKTNKLSETYEININGFKNWVIENFSNPKNNNEPNWENKENGRNAESVINTLITHMNRYGKIYSKAAIYGSKFSTQEDFIYLISLKSFGGIKKTELIKKNVHEKPVGIKIINRLIKHGWVIQIDSPTDKRSKIIAITEKGLEALENQFDKIRKATRIVAGNLTYTEKLNLIQLLNKLNDFHYDIYCKNLKPKILLETVMSSIDKN